MLWTLQKLLLQDPQALEVELVLQRERDSVRPASLPADPDCHPMYNLTEKPRMDLRSLQGFPTGAALHSSAVPRITGFGRSCAG